MKRAVYPGSFDPVTYGHIDIIERSAKMAEEVIVVVMANENKRPLFSIEERVELLKGSTGHIDNIKIMSYRGLLVDFVKKQQAHIIVRGLRAVTDFEYELQMAQTNRVLVPEIDTLFLTTALKYSRKRPPNQELLGNLRPRTCRYAQNTPHPDKGTADNGI